MLKEKSRWICDYLVKNSKWILPVVLIFAVALTVSVALMAGDGRARESAYMSVEGDEVSEVSVEENAAERTAVPEEVPLEEVRNGAIYTLICTYYNAYAFGDVETIKNISNYLVDTDEIAIPKMSEYVESYSDLVVYTKPGPLENSYLAYVYYKMQVKGFEEQISGMETFYICTDENGELYLNEGDVTEEEMEYIKQISLQDDVIELNNRVNVEYTETLTNNPALHYYIEEFVNEVQKLTGEALAAQIAGNGGEESVALETGTEEGAETVPEQNAADNEQTVVSGPVYAKATTTVNMRSSDSQQADKVDKVSTGTQVEVLEQRVNGWSKVSVNGKEGFIKSEYLQLISTVNSADAIGTVTAIENVNVRAAATTNSDRLGVLPGGTMVDLLAREGEWCKINYNGQAGYVKAEFLQ